jgi:hypothetical protein
MHNETSEGESDSLSPFVVPSAWRRDSTASVTAASARAAANSIIERILALDAIAPPAPRILEHCHAAARVMAQRLAEPGFNPESDGEIAALCAGEHPWRDLLELAVDYETLPVGRWQRLHQTVSRSLGPEIAGAAARGKLRLSAQGTTRVWQRLSAIDSLVGECLEREVDHVAATSPDLGSGACATTNSEAVAERRSVAGTPPNEGNLGHPARLKILLLIGAAMLIFGTAIRLKASVETERPVIQSASRR